MCKTCAKNVQNFAMSKICVEFVKNLCFGQKTECPQNVYYLCKICAFLFLKNENSCGETKGFLDLSGGAGGTAGVGADWAVGFGRGKSQEVG